MTAYPPARQGFVAITGNITRPPRHRYVAIRGHLHRVFGVWQAVERFRRRNRAAHGAVRFKRRGGIACLQLRIERHVVGFPAANANEPAVDILVVQFKCVCGVRGARAEIRWHRRNLRVIRFQQSHLQVVSDCLRISHGKCVLPVECYAHEHGKRNRVSLRRCTCAGEVHAAVRLYCERHAGFRLGCLPRQQIFPTRAHVHALAARDRADVL